MSIDFNAIGAAAALVAALTAIIAIWLEGRRSRFALGIDILMRMNDRFEGEEFKEKRKSTAKLLLEHGGTSAQIQQSEAIDDLLNFLEVIGHLVRKRVLDKELTWSHYYLWLHHYSFALNGYISSARKWEPTAWDDVDWLYKQVIPIEEKHRPPTSTGIPVEETLKEFLRRESNL